VATGDLNGDGNSDLALPGFSPSGLSVRLGGGTGPLSGNLLSNGGFEGPGAARIASEAPGVPGWEASGGMTFVRYGTSPPNLFPRIPDAPRLAGQVNLLFGGNTTGSPGTSSASQTVDVSGSASQIDTGQGSSHLSADLGGAGAFDDRMAATATFVGDGGGELGSVSIGPVTAADRHDVTTLLPRSATAAVPVGTRAIRVTLNATESDSGPTYAFADNVKLTLDLPPAEPPPPSEGVDTTPPKVQFSGKRSEKLGRFVVVHVAADEAAEADLSGVVVVKGSAGESKRGKRFSLKDSHVTLAANATTTVKLKLSKRTLKAATASRKRKAKIQMTATDASGNQGSGKTTIKLR
jgi:hypothetical protein